MTTFKIIDHDCETDPVGLKAKTCKVDAPTSAHALAEYLGVTLADLDPPMCEPDEELWHVVRGWDRAMIREVGALPMTKENA